MKYYANVFENLKRIETFLKVYKLTKLTQDEIDTLIKVLLN